MSVVVASVKATQPSDYSLLAIIAQFPEIFRRLAVLNLLASVLLKYLRFKSVVFELAV